MGEREWMGLKWSDRDQRILEAQKAAVLEHAAKLDGVQVLAAGERVIAVTGWVKGQPRSVENFRTVLIAREPFDDELPPTN